MNDLPLNALRAFALTVAAGGVRAAARELGVSHSAVSRHLLELEKWLARPLFERSRGRAGIRPTAQGRQLAARITRALREMSSAAQEVRERRSAFTVTVGAAPSVAARWLMPQLPRLEKAHPRIEVSVLVDQRMTDPREAGCDLSIRMGRGPWPGVDATPLMSDTLCPMMSPAAWERAGRPSTPAQLTGLKLLHDRDPNASWAAWRERFGPPDLEVRRGPRFDSSDLVLRAAVHGLGVALARGRLAEMDMASGALVRPLGDLSIELPDAYWVVCPAGEKRTATSTVIAWLRQAAAGSRKAGSGLSL
jgi:LysR family transcriptional regulator, glycine cleavage system transcriptional activator